MDKINSKSSVIVWLDTNSAGQIASLFELVSKDIKIVAIGGRRDETIDKLAQNTGANRYDDFRTMIVETEFNYVLIASMESIDTKDLFKIPVESLILTLEPIFSDLSSLHEIKPSKISNEKNSPSSIDTLLARVINVPSFINSFGFHQSQENFAEIGEGKMIVFHSHIVDSFISLFACLFEAWNSALEFTSIPISINAAICGQPQTLPDNIRNIHGHLIAHGYTSGGDCISITATDRAATPRRFMQILGDKAGLKISDSGYDFKAIIKEKIDSAGEVHQPAPNSMYAHLITNQWAKIEQYSKISSLTINPQRYAKTLACCQASLLSARTGEPEQPGKLLKINR